MNGAKLGTASQAYLESRAVSDTKVLISDLCRQFYNLGWVSGTGGSITIKVHDDSVPKPQQLVVMSPSGIFHSIYTAPFLGFLFLVSGYSLFLLRLLCVLLVMCF